MSPGGGSISTVSGHDNYAAMVTADSLDLHGAVRAGAAPAHVDVSPDGATAYITNGEDDTVTVIDTATMKPVDTIQVDTSSGACEPAPGRGLAECFTQVNRDGYRIEATYHPSSRFWRFQWLEAGMYAGLALGLAGFSLWWLGRRAS